MPLEPHLRIEPIAQHVMEHLHGGKIARRIELRFASDAVEQDIERAFEPAVAEIVEAGRIDRLFEQETFFEPRRVDHAKPAPTLDHAVRDIDETRSARRLDRLVVQAGWPFKLLELPLNVWTLEACPQKDKARRSEVSGQGECEKA